MDRRILIENILTLLPLLHKKFSKDMASCSISRQQMELLFHVNLDGDKPMSYYGTKLMISKPNLTVLADKLIEEGYIERVLSPADRRVVLLRMTAQGLAFFETQKQRLVAMMLEKLEVYEDYEILRLNELFSEIRAIFLKEDASTEVGRE